ncbi:Bicarbonate transport ATP-binding protein CmpC [Lacunisphaera limnophila]|uniref:Bicarbonate transport ATP-binding protein CmpC n=1 Tax=Lacunisphaera limnophila TaxID=1838286 RepID=A0A1D8AZ62_9BACT|nr:CmpA/NrtA family ABC transporter substrate-binding protein [Lacunisphaera limnophila]AOS46165.1 Bicarbonate transport ATP-binding protein CmpC [Lacunisphaera limnophila]
MPAARPTSATPRPLRLGFISLTDAAPLIAAQELGCFARRGLAVELCREVGWATIRDKVTYGELDGAHAPAPMLWATKLGLGCAPADVSTGFIFNLHGNAITLSVRLWEAGVRDAASLREDALRRRGENKLMFGIVFPHSMHHLLLLHWLRAARLDPERDVRIAVVPPAQMFRNLVAGTLDGYCAGEPWNTLAVQQNQGWCPAWSSSLAPGHVEKVLMVRNAFAEHRAPEHAALIAALAEAAAWCDQPANRAALAGLLAAPAYLNLPAAVIEPALVGRFSPRAGVTETVPDFLVFNRGDANAPTAERAATLQNDLVVAGLIPRSLLNASLPRRLFREDLYREATTNLDPHAHQQLKLPDGTFVSA